MSRDTESVDLEAMVDAQHADILELSRKLLAHQDTIARLNLVNRRGASQITEYIDKLDMGISLNAQVMAHELAELVCSLQLESDAPVFCERCGRICGAVAGGVTR